MKYVIEMSTKFKKDYQLAKKRGYDIRLLKEVIELLAEGKCFPKSILTMHLAAIMPEAGSVIFCPIGCLFTELRKSF